MTTFVNKLSTEEIKLFIKSMGFDVENIGFSKPLEVVEHVKQGFFEFSLYKFNFIFDDFMFMLIDIMHGTKIIKDFATYEAYISSSDWRCFLKKQFGEEYVEAYYEKFGGMMNSSSEFVECLDIDDVWALCGSDVEKSTICEVEAFEDGCRRFKYSVSYMRKEIVISAYYYDGFMHEQISEEAFLSYMYKKFGERFSTFYFQTIDKELKKINQIIMRGSSIAKLENCEKELRVAKSLEAAKKVFKTVR